MSAITAPRRLAVRADPRPGVRYYGLLLPGVILLTFALFIIHISIGSANIPLDQVFNVLLGRESDPLARTVIWDLRLPRALIALGAGAMLALAGALLQAFTRNPLAEPDLTGAASGGVLFAVLWLSRDMLGWDFAPAGIELPFVALAGSLLAGVLVYVLTGKQRSNPVAFVLTGVLVTTILKSMTSILLLKNQNAIGSIFLWMVGSLNGRTWANWDLLWPWATVSIPLGLLCAGLANGLQLGDGVAAGLGMKVERARAVLLVVAVLLTAGAVATIGALGFLGLIAPHLARRLVGDDARRAFPLSAAIGAAMLIAADLISRGITEVISLPVGAVMALIGAPFLMVLLRRSLR